MSQPGPSSAPPPDRVEELSPMTELPATGTPRPRYASDYYRTPIQRLFDPLRRKISQRRARFEFQNINLDMAYITDRIIALGYPSAGLEGLYRNTLSSTVALLERRHGTDRVKVFNLRGGVFYDPKHFQNNVIAFNMIDHHPPRLELMAPFCREAKSWLDRDPRNVIAVHCKAGKGRTGVMICAFLIYINFYSNPRQVLDYYSIVRTTNNKGVTIPSQRRYIYYYNYMRQYKLNYFPRQMQLLGVYVERPPRTSSSSINFKIKVSNGSTVVFTPPACRLTGKKFSDEKTAWKHKEVRMKSPIENDDLGRGEENLLSRRAYSFMVDSENPVFVDGDVRVDLLADGRSRFKSNKIGHVWFNTMFVCNGDSARRPDFRYGDAQWPYPENETLLAKKKIPENEKVMKDTEGKPPIVLSSGLKIQEPPGIDEHTPEESKTLIYKNHGMPLPRHHISHVLHDAHKRGIVTDEYSKRREVDTATGRSSRLVHEGMTSQPMNGNDGPLKIHAVPDQHVLCFPVYEMDRACKDDRLRVSGPRIYVVLRCIDHEDREMMDKCSVFCQTTKLNDDVQAARADRKIPERYRATALPDAVGAELRVPQVIRFASEDGNYNAKSDANLSDEAFADNEKAQDQQYCRYFYKQRRDSLSRYPTDHECPLLIERRKRFPSIDRSREAGSSSVPQQSRPYHPVGGMRSDTGSPVSRQSESSQEERSSGTSETSGSIREPFDPETVPEFVTQAFAEKEDPESQENFSQLMEASRELDRLYPGPGHAADRLFKQVDNEEFIEESDIEDEADYRDDAPDEVAVPKNEEKKEEQAMEGIQEATGTPESTSTTDKSPPLAEHESEGSIGSTPPSSTITSTKDQQQNN